jgi:hypothetical protein
MYVFLRPPSYTQKYMHAYIHICMHTQTGELEMRLATAKKLMLEHKDDWMAAGIRYMHVHVCMYVRMCVCMNKYVNIYKCMYACAYVCVYACMYACMRILEHKDDWMAASIRYMHVHVCTYVCVYA